MSAVNFDSVANSYDQLARMAFGNALVKSQLFYLNQLPQTGKILIIGGGTGIVLEYIDRPDLEIHFVEKSRKMLARAQSRKCKSKVDFIHGGLDRIDKNYDAVLTFYFLDVFERYELEEVIDLLQAALKSDGIWLVADFQLTNRLHHRLLLKLMYFFFRITTHMKVQQLYDFEQILLLKGLILKEKKLFKNGFVKSFLLQKSS